MLSCPWYIYKLLTFIGIKMTYKNRNNNFYHPKWPLFTWNRKYNLLNGERIKKWQNSDTESFARTGKNMMKGCSCIDRNKTRRLFSKMQAEVTHFQFYSLHSDHNYKNGENVPLDCKSDCLIWHFRDNSQDGTREIWPYVRIPGIRRMLHEVLIKRKRKD